MYKQIKVLLYLVGLIVWGLQNRDSDKKKIKI